MLPFARLPALAVLSAAIAAAPLPLPVQAQTPVGTLITFVVPSGDFGSKNFTDLLVNTMGAAKAFCGKLDTAYRVDCLAERIGKLANDIPADSDYAEVRQVLNDTAREMSALARANRDRTLPRRTASVGGSAPQRTTRPLIPVSPGALAAVNQQAAAILDRTQTLLLRSPDDEGGKKLHYARIAEALGSNKTLLRST